MYSFKRAHFYTALSFFFFFCPQKYVAVGELGKATDTLDATGSVIQEKDFGKCWNENDNLFGPTFWSAKLIFYSCVFVFIYFILFYFFTSADHVTKADLEEKLKAFTGDIMQVPPLWVLLSADLSNPQ